MLTFDGVARFIRRDELLGLSTSFRSNPLKEQAIASSMSLGAHLVEGARYGFETPKTVSPTFDPNKNQSLLSKARMSQ